MTAKELAITYRTLKSMVTEKKGLLPALRAVKNAWDTLPADETQGRHIATFKTNQGGRQRGKYTSKMDSQIIDLYRRDASYRTIAGMVDCSLKHVQEVIEDLRLIEEDERFWASLANGKGKEATPAEVEGQLHFPGFDAPKEDGQ